MDPELEKEEKVSAEGVSGPGAEGVQAASDDDEAEEADELTDIEPAEFFDPEEFGYRRAKGRFHDHRRP